MPKFHFQVTYKPVGLHYTARTATVIAESFVQLQLIKATLGSHYVTHFKFVPGARYDDVWERMPDDSQPADRHMYTV